MDIADQIIQVESAGNPNAHNPRSSAGGLGQFTDKTWLNMIRAHRPDLAARYSTSDLLGMKTDPDLSREMTNALVGDNAGYLQHHGIPATPGNIYLAHFAGPQAAAAVLGADPNAKVDTVLPPSAMKANPFLRDMTVADLQRWSTNKMTPRQAAPVPPAPIPAPAPTQVASAAPLVPLDITSRAPMPSPAAPQPSAPPSAPSGFDQFAQPPVVPSAAAGMLAGGGSPSPMLASMPASPVQAAADTGNGAAGIPALLQKLQAQPPAAPVHIDYPETPGMARARALIRAMAQAPLTGGQA